MKNNKQLAKSKFDENLVIDLYSKIICKLKMSSFYKKYSRTTICVVGLGYIGGPLSYQFAEKYNVIGFDKDLKRVKKLNRDIDQNKQISKKQFKKVRKNILITSNVNKISHANVYIIAVPTPIQNNKT